MNEIEQAYRDAKLKRARGNSIEIVLTDDIEIGYKLPDGRTVDAQQVVRYLMERTGKRAGEIQSQGGINHPRVYNVSVGKSKALEPIALAYLTEGYTITLTPMNTKDAQGGPTNATTSR